MEKFYFERPSMERKNEIIEYLDEFIKYGSEINGSGSLDKIYHGSTFEEALDKCLKMEDEEYAKSVGRCPGKTFLLIRENDNKIVGTINVRWNLNEAMLNYGGHIGYGIRPTERKKGYNKINLYLGLKVCDKHGIDKVIMNADINNIASWKTMESLGGKRVKEYYKEDEKETIVDYNIDVKESLRIYRNIYEPYIK